MPLLLLSGKKKSGIVKRCRVPPIGVCEIRLKRIAKQLWQYHGTPEAFR
jgi:hypothetical protein